jgi:hypothetical protein
MAQVTAPAGTQLRFEEEAEFGQPSEVSPGTSGLRFSGGGRRRMALIISFSPLMMTFVWA